MTDTSGSYISLGRTVRKLLKVRRVAKGPLLVGTDILLFLSIFTKRQASSPFEAMISAHLSMCQKDVRPAVQGNRARGGSLVGFLELRQAPGVYARVTTAMPIVNGSLFSEVRTLV